MQGEKQPVGLVDFDTENYSNNDLSFFRQKVILYELYDNFFKKILDLSEKIDYGNLMYYKLYFEEISFSSADHPVYVLNKIVESKATLECVKKYQNNL